MVNFCRPAWSHNYVDCKFVFDPDNLFDTDNDTDQIINATGQLCSYNIYIGVVSM